MDLYSILNAQISNQAVVQSRDSDAMQVWKLQPLKVLLSSKGAECQPLYKHPGNKRQAHLKSLGLPQAYLSCTFRWTGIFTKGGCLYTLLWCERNVKWKIHQEAMNGLAAATVRYTFQCMWPVETCWLTLVVEAVSLSYTKSKA